MDSREIIHINERVSYSGRRGTVRFYGRIDEWTNQPGDWAGIEWDEPKAGLHDGVIKGKRLFQARANSASFLLGEKLSRGITAWQAIQVKYGTQGSSTDIGVRFGDKEVVAVGWDKVQKKISDYNGLVHVDLTEMDVNDEQDVELRSVIPNVETLSLGKSLISSWTTVIKLITGLDRLTTLNLRDNRLLTEDAPVPPNLTIKRLILHHNNLIWEDVLKITELFSELEELYLSENFIDKLDTTELLKHSSISFIDLDSQLVPFTDWMEVMKLSSLVRLQSLQLSGNPFRSIEIRDDGSLFPALTHLTLRYCDISDWKSVSELDKLPLLENLKINFNPVTDAMEPETARQCVIARIGGLKVLNQSPITPTERKDSELDYMRRYGSEWLATCSLAGTPAQKAAFLALHPRYLHILGKLGPLEAGEMESAMPKQLKDSLVKVTIQSGEVKQEKNIPLTISVLKLKRLVERVFHLHDTKELWYSTSEMPGIRYVLDDDQKDIAHYDIKTGDIIMIR